MRTSDASFGNDERYVDLVTVYVAQGMLRAMVIRGALESAGIPVMLSYEAIAPTLGLTVSSTGQVKIMVPAEWADEARDLLNAEPRRGEVFSMPPHNGSTSAPLEE
ncbi:MAG: DUF2007 domain-containing protein [Anaerolineae bacterium]|nr:DUF2007 domain-containing protein [Anaerolineae bacterium]